MHYVSNARGDFSPAPPRHGFQVLVSWSHPVDSHGTAYDFPTVRYSVQAEPLSPPPTDALRFSLLVLSKNSTGIKKNRKQANPSYFIKFGKKIAVYYFFEILRQ
jgi:hypothetical protein